MKITYRDSDGNPVKVVDTKRILVTCLAAYDEAMLPLFLADAVKGIPGMDIEYSVARVITHITIEEN